MSKKNESIIDFVQEMKKCTLDDYKEIKMIMLIANRDKPEVVNFLNKILDLIESERPLLIEMNCQGRSQEIYI